MVEKGNPIRPTTPQAIDLARRLTRDAKFGSLAVLDVDSGSPFVSRVAASVDNDCSPIILVSELSHHTKCLLNDPRCSVLFGEPGKGDPLAYPRVSLSCYAVRVLKTDIDASRFAATFVEGHPKARLYISFADFFFFRLKVLTASLNGGFGQAFVLGAVDFYS